MRLGGPSGRTHLTYCTNIHAADHWPDVLAELQRHLPAIKRDISPDQAFGIGLRVSASAAASLGDASALSELQDLLREGPYYIFTINGFPHGAFHGEAVKEGAYRPDWSTQPRLDYTNSLADILAALLPDGMDGSISTVPGTFKPWATDDVVEAIADNLIKHIAHLVRIREITGKSIALALEPEPCCLLETIAETIEFFEARLFSAAAKARLVELSGLTQGAAEAALRLHLGVCYDVCHAAVEFEDPRASIKALQNAGIAISKLQLSSAMRIPRVGLATAEQLQSFVEPVYLHQVVERGPDGLVRYTDLPDALANLEPAVGREWRIHFHVPIFLEEMAEVGTTQAFLRDILAIQRDTPITNQLEVETYTWDVLPETYRNVGVSAAIARELAWVRDQLAP
jgi:hypothetical protein